MRIRYFCLVFGLLLVFLIGCVDNSVDVVVDDECNYGDEVKKYTGKSEDECARIQFLCEPGHKPFTDECGCGCEVDEEGRNFCTEEQRKADACIGLYQPVCGYFDPEKIQCVAAPCAKTFSNSCFSCMDKNILHWVEGECPSIGKNE